MSTVVDFSSNDFNRSFFCEWNKNYVVTKNIHVVWFNKEFSIALLKMCLVLVYFGPMITLL